MVLLKEVNSSDGGWDLQQFVREKGYLKESSTWPVLLSLDVWNPEWIPRI